MKREGPTPLPLYPTGRRRENQTGRIEEIRMRSLDRKELQMSLDILKCRPKGFERLNTRCPIDRSVEDPRVSQALGDS